jgi:hypothetical protein
MADNGPTAYHRPGGRRCQGNLSKRSVRHKAGRSGLTDFLGGRDARRSVGRGDDAWHAYLSTQGPDAVNARDRIGTGPWHNANGAMVAASIDALHGENNLTAETQVNENGTRISGRGMTPNRHDVITGSMANGMAFEAGPDRTCGNWTSEGSNGSARVGHFDREGGGEDGPSWNSAHNSNGCGQEALQGTGGDGLFYCFAAD